MLDLTKFKPAERRILTYVVAHPTATKSAIAAALRLTRPHVSKVMNSPHVREALGQLQLEQFAEASRVSCAAATEAVAVLTSIMKDATATNSDRIRAAKALLDFRLMDMPEKPQEPVRYRVVIDEGGVIHQHKEPLYAPLPDGRDWKDVDR